MKYKKSLLALTLAMCILFSVSFAFASDSNDTAIAIENTDDIVEIEDKTALQNDLENDVQAEDSQTTFSALNKTINDNGQSEIYLENNYKFNESDADFKDGIIINRTITVYGNGHTIDGNGSARIFTVTGSNVIFRDLIFINGKTSGNGGAINGFSTVINCTFNGNTASNGGAINNGIAINSTFTNNKAALHGGAARNLTAYNCNFTSNTANSGGAIRGGEAHDCNFINNTGDTYGGAVVYVTASGCNFTNNTGSNGGAGYYGKSSESVFEDEFILTDCRFTNNSGNSGGALYGAIAVNCIFTDNKCSSNGGALYESTAINCRIMNNTAQYNGGGSYKGNIANCILEGNSAADGGAMYDGTATNCTFIANNATNGGGVYRGKVSKGTIFKNNSAVNGNDTYNTTFFEQESKNHFTDLYQLISAGDDIISLNGDYVFDLSYDYEYLNGMNINRSMTIIGNGFTIDGSGQARIFTITPGVEVAFKKINFINAKTSSMGGAIYGDAIVRDCTFINNSAKLGGAIYGNSHVYDSTFLNNSAMGIGLFHGYGGAMNRGYAQGCTFKYNTANHCGAFYNGTAYNCMFIANSAPGGGGAFRIGNATQCTFIDNYAGIYGGAVRESIVRNCIFINNTAGDRGGAIYGFEAYDCTFIGNSASNGGAAYDTKIYNSRFDRNHATEGGAAYDVTAVRCEFTNNYASNNGGAMYAGEINSGIFKNNTAMANGSNTYRTNIIIAPTKIASPSITTVYNGGKYLIATLKNDYGDSLSGIKLTVILNGKTLTPTTDKNGQVKISTAKLVPKAYDVTIRFDGNAYFAKSTATSKITVKKASVKLTAKKKTFKAKAKVKKYTVTLKDSKGKAIKKVKLTLKIKGKTYRAKTNRKGMATVGFKNLKVGKYEITVKYIKSTVKTILKVKK